jgi:alpha-tubulin suppressor-like RCC1 family protein
LKNGLTLLGLFGSKRRELGAGALVLGSVVVAVSCTVDTSDYMFDDVLYDDAISNAQSSGGDSNGGSGSGADTGNGAENGGGSGGASGSIDCTVDEWRCTSEGVLQQCKDGTPPTWGDEKDCEGAGKCNATTHECLDCAPGAYRCDDGMLQMCDLAGSAYDDVMDCGSNSDCVANATGGSCKVCDPESYECLPMGQVDLTQLNLSEENQFALESHLLQCNDAGTYQIVADRCQLDQPACDADAGACMACIADEKACDGSYSRTCESDGSGYTNDYDYCYSPYLCCEDGKGGCTEEGECFEPEQCNPGQHLCDYDVPRFCAANGYWTGNQSCGTPSLCDTNSLSCYSTCVPGAGRCNGNTVERCDESGSFWHGKTTCYSAAYCDEYDPNGDDSGDASCSGYYQQNGYRCDAYNSDLYYCYSALADCTYQGNCGGACNMGTCYTCTPGAYRCGPSGDVEQCDGTGTYWELLEDCDDVDSLGIKGFCNLPLKKCLIANPYNGYCDNNGDYYTVDGNGEAEFEEACGSQQACDPMSGCVYSSNSCKDDLLRCEGNGLMVCDGGYYDDSETCAADVLCGVGTGCLKATSVFAGKSHTCAIVAGLDAEEGALGRMVCWGANENGQLGNGATVLGSAEPRHVVLNFSEGGDTGTNIVYPIFKQGCAGVDFTCGVLEVPFGETQSVLACWGSNEFGQLPWDSSASGPFNGIPIQMVSESESQSYGMVDVACGDHFACARNENDAVYCWGENDKGQVGTGDDEAIIRGPTRISGHSFVQIGAGGKHACGVKSDGSLWCWGEGTKGQLGQGTDPVDSNEPVQVGELAVSKVLRPALGSDFSIVIPAEGDPMVWGRNGYGQLGIGTNETQWSPVAMDMAPSKPVPVSGPTAHHACARAGDKLYCWGSGATGQLGQGDRGLDRYEPTVVFDGDDADEKLAPGGGSVIAVGWGHTCAIVSTGQVMCWGANGQRQLGSSVAGNPELSPTAVEFP